MRFFNKIRKALIISDNFKKYLLYALGEIVLVLLGILIALQINSWNENRKKETLELKLLSEVLISIKADEESLEEIIYFYQKKQELVKKIKITLEKDTINEDSIALDLGSVSLLYPFRTDYSVFESIKSAGLTNIQNDSIRILLPTYYFQTNDAKEVFHQFDVAKHFRDNIYPKYFKSFDYGLIGARPKDINIIKSNNEIKVALDYILNDARFYVFLYSDLISINRKLQKKIKSELKKRM